ncbi:hypothetical protein HNO88_004370 [Novosphingobium chloroacetimidivorans]|uniref:Uncharacterized protein n=1 Tax=Novosphingobium chloroacetimidivorans TaxID=1428314 RepID=A0A7W7NZA5_9SPHN|nr:hypothetical protein [Novosphingobium chloroacetimidivorans]MBB4861022.1 hypothetical protein [Novosphingobium chloroacetimidivorans]
MAQWNIVALDALSTACLHAIERFVSLLYERVQLFGRPVADTFHQAMWRIFSRDEPDSDQVIAGAGSAGAISEIVDEPHPEGHESYSPHSLPLPYRYIVAWLLKASDVQMTRRRLSINRN